MICNDEDTDGRARVTADEERVLHIQGGPKIGTVCVEHINFVRY